MMATNVFCVINLLLCEDRIEDWKGLISRDSFFASFPRIQLIVL